MKDARGEIADGIFLIRKLLSTLYLFHVKKTKIRYLEGQKNENYYHLFAIDLLSKLFIYVRNVDEDVCLIIAMGVCLFCLLQGFARHWSWWVLT